jgi:hypothetical protein
MVYVSVGVGVALFAQKLLRWVRILWLSGGKLDHAPKGPCWRRDRHAGKLKGIERPAQCRSLDGQALTTEEVGTCRIRN